MNGKFVFPGVCVVGARSFDGIGVTAAKVVKLYGNFVFLG
jgi:hypothetical protein